MQSERWLRVAIAASTLLLVVAAGAFAAQMRTSQEAARLRSQLTALQRRPKAATPSAAPGSGMRSSPVMLTRVRIVPQSDASSATASSAGTTRQGARQDDAGDRAISGAFSVQATVTNRSDRTLRQPVYAVLLVSDPSDPSLAPEIQRQHAVIDSLAPGDTTTVTITGLQARKPAMRHEVVVTTPAVDPGRVGGTLAKIVPVVKEPPQASSARKAASEPTASTDTRLPEQAPATDGRPAQ